MTKRVVIDRSKWRSGLNEKYKTGYGMTQLVNSQGFSCCLGFAACQLSDKPSSEFLNMASPSDLDFLIQPLNTILTTGQSIASDFTIDAMLINDNEELPVKNKEKQLVILFDKNGLELEFVGEYSAKA